jgi:hypothetical protein
MPKRSPPWPAWGPWGLAMRVSLGRKRHARTIRRRRVPNRDTIPFGARQVGALYRTEAPPGFINPAGLFIVLISDHRRLAGLGGLSQRDQSMDA